MEYKDLPEILRELFVEDEYKKNINNNVEATDITDFYRSHDAFADVLDEEVFNYSRYYSAIRSHGFAGPVYDSIDQVCFEKEDNVYSIYGKFNCYIYDGEENKFNAVKNELLSYKYEEFSISAVTNAADEKGLRINIDIFKEHQNVHWIEIWFTLAYKIE